jgi:hypothetical protein
MLSSVSPSCWRPGISGLRCSLVRWFAVAAVLAGFAVCAAGCKTTPGTPWEQRPLPPGTPALEEIVAGLAANEQALDTFQGACAFTLESPELAATQYLQKSSVYFRRPADLRVIGRKYGSTVVRLTCVGSEFLIEFPTEKEYYYRFEGERVSQVEFSVSPSDIAREMFLPEAWSQLPEDRLRLVSYDPDTQQAGIVVLEPGGRAVRRRVIAQGAPWVVAVNERLNSRGEVIARTTAGDYRDVHGVYLPAWVESAFPQAGTRMRLDFRALVPNEPLPDKDFDIAARAAELRILLERAPGEPQQGKY